jgi:hypothetical protein
MRYLIFDSVWSSYQFPCPSHCPICKLVPVLPVPIRCRRHILFCAADPTLPVPLSCLHSIFSGSSHRCMSLHSALVHWTVRKRLNEPLVSPMIENEVVDWLQKSLVFRHRKNDHDIPLCLSKYTRLPWSGRTFWQVNNSLIFELTVKVIILVIVKHVEGKMQFCCSTCPMRSARFWQ